MIAVVYSGSRNADWKLSDKGRIVCDLKTAGINPFFNDERTITSILNKNNQLINHAEEIKRIYFFGAGASSKERQQVVANAFSGFFRNSKIYIAHDLKAAALATCGDSPGIVGILGSGANAAYFNGKKIKQNNFGMGYILADEGSSNWLGRSLLRDYFTGVLPKEFEDRFVQKYNPDRKLILDKIYKQTSPVLFLSSYTDFLIENLDQHYVRNLVKTGFKLYFANYIMPLAEKYPGLPLHFTGPVAAGFQQALNETAIENNLTISSIIKRPIYNILNYYTNKN
ncbi:hypothetical protein BDE36_4019 [Arcticibacter tournemirensis]|uniref:N-acetylglucosamine kinase n=1 Tax=Arcticibacter tournemirensis TaxID=699437 RepID=A0A4Q0MCT3_9SPHI|nr:hypothetical protein [Arcticibacter tournemirensis]KAA8481885.1 hypothetical protein F1649_13290 [Arcticibacter tournemirensis]RXF71188.1 hypothetical protein EKH83_05700 [Arcticibacter tournemirensis]TQM52216.1 hypothetical protein BDE36_4019 [Arcticibacter tournemirensis]